MEAFLVDDEVDVKSPDGEWYPAVIIKVNPKVCETESCTPLQPQIYLISSIGCVCSLIQTYVVRFDDDGSERRVFQSSVRSRSADEDSAAANDRAENKVRSLLDRTIRMLRCAPVFHARLHCTTCSWTTSTRTTMMRTVLRQPQLQVTTSCHASAFNVTPH